VPNEVAAREQVEDGRSRLVVGTRRQVENARDALFVVGELKDVERQPVQAAQRLLQRSRDLEPCFGARELGLQTTKLVELIHGLNEQVLGRVFQLQHEVVVGVGSGELEVTFGPTDDSTQRLHGIEVVVLSDSGVKDVSLPKPNAALALGAPDGEHAAPSR